MKWLFRYKDKDLRNASGAGKASTEVHTFLNFNVSLAKTHKSAGERLC